jgi:spoIIIJ-associated protein
MFNQENIKKIVEEFFKKGTFDINVKASIKEGVVVVDLATEDPQILIGEKGQTLNEIQYLLKAVLRKKLALAGFSEFFYLNLDINNYKQKKSEFLKEMARSVVSEVVLSKKEKVFPPMPAYERRVIHLELAGRDDVFSESIGKGLERSIVIKPRL